MMRGDRNFPPALSAGATIGIAAPAGLPADKVLFAEGIRILHELGFVTKFPRNLWPGHDFFADSDSNRLEEFHRLWCDEDVDAIMAARGGYGCLRIIPDLDYTELAHHQKLLIGFSDITCLHACLNRNCSLVTLHGPVVTSLPQLSRKALELFHYQLHHDLREWKYAGSFEILRSHGNACGISAGGNLSTLVSLLGTVRQPDWSNCLIFLEDTGEHTYKVDRMLTQLSQAGMLDEVKGVILGDFSHGLGLDSVGRQRHSEHIWQRVLELVPENAAVIGAFPFGHGKENYAFPLGAELSLDTSAVTISVIT